MNTGQARSDEGNISLRGLDAGLNPPAQLPQADPARLQWHGAANVSLTHLPDGLQVELRITRSNRVSKRPHAFSSGEARSILRTSLLGTTILPRSDMFGRLLNAAASVHRMEAPPQLSASNRNNNSIALARAWKCASAVTDEDL